ncbi:hypothetical protein ACOM2C_06660 [Pseudarthrobacter sp. So.54]
MTPTAPWTCPDCGGAWIRNFVFDHNPETCQLRDREDATQCADHERLDGTSLPLERPATPTEIQLADVVRGFALLRAAQYVAPGQPAPESKPVMTKVSRLAPGVHCRIIAGVDPDELAKAGQA